MRLLSSVTLRTLVPVLLCAGGLSWAAVGCDGASPSGYYDPNGGAPPPDETITSNPDKVAIDTGATLSSPGGAGVGVFVQYAAGGHWTVNTACDTNTSGQSCGFDVFVSVTDPKSALSNPAGTSLNERDGVDIQSDGSFHLFTNTANAVEGMTFDATPGATVEVEMYLDGVPQPRFVYWIGGKVLHTGAPTDPIDLSPSAP